MRVFQLRAVDLFCLHIYLILLIQLFANWKAYDCDHNMSVALLFIYLIYVCRVIIVQAGRLKQSYQQAEQKQRLLYNYATVPCSVNLLTFFKYCTEIVLIGMNILLIVTLAQYKKKFAPEICASRDSLILFIVVNFLIILKSLIHAIIVLITKNTKNELNNQNQLIQ